MRLRCPHRGGHHAAIRNRDVARCAHNRTDGPPGGDGQVLAGDGPQGPNKEFIYADSSSPTGKRSKYSWYVNHGTGMAQFCFVDGHAATMRLTDAYAMNALKFDCQRLSTDDRTWPYDATDWTDQNGWWQWVCQYAASDPSACIALAQQLVAQENLPSQDSLLSVDDVIGVAGSPVTLSATLTSGGSALNQKSIDFTIGTTSVSGMTDSNGTATASYTIPIGLAAGAYTITASFDGDTANTSGQGTGTLTVSVAQPADANHDFRVVVSEVTGYGAAWKKGASWPSGPNPILVSYVTNMGALWKGGELYHYDSSLAPPLCWVLGSRSDAPIGRRLSARAQCGFGRVASPPWRAATREGTRRASRWLSRFARRRARALALGRWRSTFPQDGA